MNIKLHLHNYIESFIFSILNSILAFSMLIYMIKYYINSTFLQSGINKPLCLAIILGVASTFIITLFKIREDLKNSVL
jgi:uncharacterized protein with PQ loop repeat